MILPLIGLSAKITVNLLFRSRLYCCCGPAMGANYLWNDVLEHDGLVTNANGVCKVIFVRANSLKFLSSDSLAVCVASGVGRSVTEHGKKSESSNMFELNGHISFTLNQF